MKDQDQTNSTNIKWHNLTIDRDQLEKMRGHKGMVIWFTGLSGSGKSTLANALNEVLHLEGFSTYVLDGDNIRITITAFVSPFISDRDKVRKIIGSKDFIEVYCAADIKVCENRDTKGLYKKARMGEIKDFTGISSPYEAPHNPEIIVDTGSLDLKESVEKVINYLKEENFLKKS